MKFFRNLPLYIILLPLFFVLHGVRENFGFVLPKDYLPLVLFYCLSSIALYFIFYLFYRQRNKAALLTFALLSIFFFYGAFQDFLANFLPGLNHYRLLIPFFLCILIALAIFLKRTKRKMAASNLFLNTLFLIYLIVDLSMIAGKILFLKNNTASYPIFSFEKNFNPCPDCQKPDIYFLVFDEYTSSIALKNNFGFNNEKLDSFLIKNKFRILSKSYSNYNYTPFSMASIMNMDYLNKVHDGYVFTTAEYMNCFEQVKKSELIRMLSAMGYDIANYSIFDLPEHPTQLMESLFPAKSRLITDQTLWGRAQKNILWNLFMGRFEVKFLSKNLLYNHLNNNVKTANLLKNEINKKASSPRFVYAHFMIPHPPYYFDSTGKLKPKNEILFYKNEKESYLNNLKYANTQIQDLVTDIQQQSNGGAAIILMGDHGFRYDTTMPKLSRFQNLNAVYLPGNNYKLFYDSMSAVNEFRVVTNTLFHATIPLLKDSTNYLIGKLH